MYKQLLAFTSFIVFLMSCKNSTKGENANDKTIDSTTESTQNSRHPLNDSRVITLGLHPDLNKLSLGWGFDSENPSLLKQTAFRPITKKNINPVPNVSINIYITKTTEEETSDFAYDTNVEASIPLIGGGGSVKMVAKTTKASAMQNVKLVILAESEYEPETPDLSTMRLTDTAESLKKNPVEFMNFYGDYYCSEIYRGQKIKVEATLSQTVSSKLETYFQEGKMKVAFKFLGGDAQNTIRTEVKRLASDQRTEIKTTSYGIINNDAYNRMVNSSVLKDTSFEMMAQIVNNILSELEYKNTRIVRCVLSDYSTWGVPGFPILYEEKIAAQKKLKKLYSDISSEINNCDVLINNTVFRSAYTQEQIETVEINSSKYIQLRNRVADAHKKLNKGDSSQLNIEKSLRPVFNQLKKNTPEVFEFIAARQVGMPMQFLRPPGLPGFGFDKIMNAIVSSQIFNTCNSLTAFNHIASLSFVNTYTNTTVFESSINTVTSGNMLKHDGVNFVPIPVLLDVTKTPQLARAMDNDMMNVFAKFLQIPHAPTDKMNFEYAMVLKDKSGRIYSFPFFEVNFELNNPAPGYNGFVTHKLPENCCTFLPDYEEPENLSTNQVGVPENSPGSINFSLKYFNLALSDSLVIELLTDNPLNNQQLKDDGEDRIVIAKKFIMDPNSPISSPLEPLAFKYNFSEFILTFYSKNKQNEIDSKKYALRVPYFRKLCAQTIYLQTN